MFLGEYSVKFTGSGRIVLPRKFREGLGEEKEAVLSRGFEGCILGFSRDEWDREAEKQLEWPLSEQKGRDLRRYLFSAAESVRLDVQGRFVIPKSLLDYAGLKNEAVIVGAGDHFEIWEQKSWQKILAKLTEERKM